MTEGIKFSSDILFYAFRYALSRKTYVVDDVVNCLEQNWDNLDYQQKAVIQGEIKDAIKRQDVGMFMDIVRWQKILNLENKYGKKI